MDLAHARKRNQKSTRRDTARMTTDESDDMTPMPTDRNRVQHSIRSLSKIEHHFPNLMRNLRLQWYANPSRTLGDPTHYVVDIERNQLAQMILIGTRQNLRHHKSHTGRVSLAQVEPYGTYRPGGFFPVEKSYYQIAIDDGPISTSPPTPNPFFAEYKQALEFLQSQIPDIATIRQRDPTSVRPVLTDQGHIRFTKKVALRTPKASAVDANERAIWDPNQLLPATGDHPSWLQTLRIIDARSNQQLGPGSVHVGDLVAVNCSMVSFNINDRDRPGHISLVTKLEINSIRLLKKSEVREPKLELESQDLIA
jgi:hypothetical protein